MPKRINIVWQQECGGHSHRQEQSRDDECSPQHLDERRRRGLRFFRGHFRQRNSKFATKCVAFLDLCQAFQNFLLQRTQVLRAFIGIAAQHVGNQIPQRFWKPAQLSKPHVCQRRSARQQKIHRCAERINRRAEIDRAMLQLLRAGKLSRHCRIYVGYLAWMRMKLVSGGTDVDQLYKRPTTFGSRPGDNQQIGRLNRTMGKPVKTGGRQRADYLRCHTQNGVGRHRPVLLNPRVDSLTLQILRDIHELPGFFSEI